MNKIIVLEGIDGTGKTTVAKILAKKMKGVYYKTPPGGLESAREIFNKGEVDAKFLFYLATLINASKEIWEIAREKPVVVDRYLASTICYHQVQGANIDVVQWRNLPIVLPGLYVCLEVSDRDKWIKRVEKRSGHLESSYLNNEYLRFNNIQKSIKRFVLNYNGVVVQNNSAFPDNAANKILQIIKSGR